MAFQIKGFQEIYQSMENEIREHSTLTDFNEGSVVRTLFESFSWELSVLYQQMDLVYQSSFVDTATGNNLDKVVSVLGVKRSAPDFAIGTVTFQRESGVLEEVIIPVGTLLSTEETEEQPKKTYKTIEEGTIQEGLPEIDIRIQAEQPGADMATELETIIELPRPVAGVGSVINRQPVLFLGKPQETDEELRERAKLALLASGRASITSIENTLWGMPGVREVKVLESTLENEIEKGSIEVYVDGLNTANAPAIQKRLEENRAAGIFVTLNPSVEAWVEGDFTIEMEDRVSEEEIPIITGKVQEQLEEYLSSFKMGEPLIFSHLPREILKIRGVNDVLDFTINISKETDSAEGTVDLSPQPALGSNQVIPKDTELQNGAQFYRTTEDVTIPAGELSLVGVPVQAGTKGVNGEVLTIETVDVESAWMDLAYNGTTFQVNNTETILLSRTPYTSGGVEKRIVINPMERFVPLKIQVMTPPPPPEN